MLPNQFCCLQSNPSLIQCTYVNAFSNLQNSCYSPFLEYPSALSLIWLVSPLSTQKCPRNSFLNLLNSKKLNGAKSGQNSGCGMMWVEFFGKMVTNNQCSVRQCIIMVQKLKVVLPQFWPL